jgi:hypothetical protein
MTDSTAFLDVSHRGRGFTKFLEENSGDNRAGFCAPCCNATFEENDDRKTTTIKGMFNDIRSTIVLRACIVNSLCVDATWVSREGLEEEKAK